FQDNSGAYGSSINYHGYKLHLEGNTFQNNITTSSRATIYVDFNRVEYDGYINILDNVFLNNETRAGGSGQDRAVNLTITNVNLFSNVLIARNLFLQDNNNHPSFPCIIISGSSSNDTKIEYTNNTEMGFGNLSQYALFLSVENIPVSIKNSIFTGRIHTTNAANKTIMNSWFTNSNDPNNNIYIHGMISGIFLYNRHNLLAGNPHFTMTSLDPADPSNYYPVWNSSIKSGLINAAYLDTNSNGIPFWDDLDDGKFDGTNQDIGAVQNTRKQYVIQHDLNPDSEYIWLSFPYLDRLYGSGGGIFSHSRLSYVLGIQNENNLLSLNPRYIEYIEWKYEDSIGKVYYDDTTNYWIGDLNHLIDSRHGYKIKLNSNVTYPRPLVTNGFYCGTTNNPQNQITISAREPGEDYREVWLGYYGLNLQDPFFVFDSIIDNLIQIKTQQWSMNRDIDLSIWALPANAVSLNFGEMVSIKYIGDEDATLYFPQMFSLEDMSRYHHPTPSHFTYIEQSDYIPIYVHLPDDLTEEGIGEIGLFINDVCYGAEVIMGEVAQINAYIMDLDFDDTDIEFQIMEYGSRSGEKRFENFEVFDSVVNEFRSTTLDLNNGEMFYVVSLKNVNDMVDDLPKFTSLDGNFPNPFNPSTTIAYSLAESGNVKLQIFNIRGQLVKTLVNEIQNAGRYTVDWHGDNDRQRRVGSGVYFYRLETSAGRQVKRMVLLK
ncbi:MAG: T9SS type A sorting domain-containing protein, partial [Candidatus Cloacimonetes bacterium]|nr:T9SS type A sorting domain-containing protein [Candidatus Cloacimonadota bacterium]